MIAAFLAIVGLGSRRTGPNIAAALTAYDSAPPTLGQVVVSITAGDSTDRYRATLHEDGHADWEYEFIPVGWRPEARRYSARIWRTDHGCPLLTVVDEGLVIPRYDPTRKMGR